VRGLKRDGKVLSEVEHANVSCTFHYLALEQKQREEKDALRSFPSYSCGY
jgi:hypothetical protein